MKGQLLYHQSYVYRLHSVGVLIFDLDIGATGLFIYCAQMVLCMKSAVVIL